MTAIFTFSLDLTKDREIIDLLQSKKNRSDYIRTVLRKQLLEKLYIDAFYDVYESYSTAIKIHAGREPISKEQFIARNLNIQQPDEEECFTCNEIGEEHCNIHKNYSE